MVIKIITFFLVNFHCCYLYYKALFNHKCSALFHHLLKKAPLFIFIKILLVLIHKKDWRHLLLLNFLW